MYLNSPALHAIYRDNAPSFVLSGHVHATLGNRANVGSVDRTELQAKINPRTIECVVRGYIIGGGWKDYQATGKVCGIELPAGLKQAQKLPHPIFTPAAKMEVGTHDENISFEQAVELVGEDVARQIRDYSIELYTRAAEYALTKGIIIADTKFEFGIDQNGTVRLMDEVLTPDSSRFWPAEGYEPGHSQPSFDKQFARDWLKENTGHDWKLPQDIVDKTIAKYLQGYELLTGKPLA